MEEKKWWTWLILVSAIVAVVLLITAPFGYRYEILPLGEALISTVVALLASLITVIGGLIMAVVATRKGLTTNRNLVLAGVVIALVPIIIMGPVALSVRSVPPIHDITTDTENPPRFDHVVDLREGAPNSLDYEPGGEVAEQQLAAYPQIEPLMSSLAAMDALARAESVLAAQGLEVVNRDDNQRIVEAVATTKWFGFKDDVVVRVTPTDSGSQIDVRSVSRVGQSDLGANAARISAFLEAFEG